MTRSSAPSLTKLLVFVVVTFLSTGALAAVISNTHVEQYTAYSARFTDATGLNPGDDVRIAGVQVGQVDAVRIADRRQAEVTFRMFGQRKVRSSATAVIKYRNLAGQRQVAIEQGGAGPRSVLPGGTTIPVERTRPALNLTVLFNGFKPLFQALSPEDVNQLSYEIIQILQGEGGTINSLLSHIGSLTSAIASRDQVVGQVVDNLNAVLDTVNARGDEASDTVLQMQKLVSGLAADRRPIGDAVAGVGELTEATSGLLGESRAPLQADIAGIGRLSQNLDDHHDQVEQVIRTLPHKAATLTRVGSYGSWFNFYLCGLSGQVGAANLDARAPITPVPGTTPSARCDE